MTPKQALIYPQKQDAGRAQSRPPGATMAGPVPSGPRSQARASSGPCPASSTTLPLEEDPRPSRGGSRKVTKTSQISGFTQFSTSGLIPRLFGSPGWTSGGILSLVEIRSRSGLRSDCGSIHNLPGPSRGPGFGKTGVPLGCVRPLEGCPIGCSSPRAPPEGPFRVWPSVRPLACHATWKHTFNISLVFKHHVPRGTLPS